MTEDDRAKGNHFIEATVTSSAFNPAYRYGVLFMIIVYTAGIGVIVSVLIGHAGVFTAWEAVILLGVLVAVIIDSIWRITNGRLAAPATLVRLSQESLVFVYESSRSLELDWKDSEFRSVIRDVCGPWDRNHPNVLSHKYWMEPPRGAMIAIEESFFKAVLEQATRNGLPITKSEYGGAVYNRRHRLVRIRYRIGGWKTAQAR